MPILHATTSAPAIGSENAKPSVNAFLAQHGVDNHCALPPSVFDTFADDVAPKDINYYDLMKYWSKKIQPHLEDEELSDILTYDFNRYTWGRWKIEFPNDKFPADYESCDWDLGHRGPRPRYWLYTKHGACHWLANFSLRLAMLSLPGHAWRIITSDFHSSVWDGGDLLFDFNFLRMGISPKECFALAHEEELEPGKYMEVPFARYP